MISFIGPHLGIFSLSAALDAYSKQFRLLADAANDVAFFITLAAPLLPRSFFPGLLCLAAVLRGVVSVAGAATRAAVVAHQAREGNVSDVAAKDGSQETAVNLFGLLLGFILVPAVSGNAFATWIVYTLLTWAHLWCNFAAVSSLRFTILNPWRADLLLRDFAESGTVRSVEWANLQEPILPWDILRHRITFPSLRLGVRFDRHNHKVMQTRERFILFGRDAAVLHADATPADALEAYAALRGVEGDAFARFMSMAKEAGWSFDRLSLDMDEWRAQW